jgi:hypothetical protein
MFLAWAIQKGLFADPEVPSEAVEAVRRQPMIARDFLLNHCDGKLFSGLFNEDGADFAEKHYDGFIDDFQRLLCRDLRSDYVVEYDDANNRTMTAALDERWAKYQQDKRKQPP